MLLFVFRLFEGGAAQRCSSAAANILFVPLFFFCAFQNKNLGKMCFSKISDCKYKVVEFSGEWRHVARDGGQTGDASERLNNMSQAVAGQIRPLRVVLLNQYRSTVSQERDPNCQADCSSSGSSSAPSLCISALRVIDWVDFFVLHSR